MKIRTFVYSFGAVAIWLYLAYLVSVNPELRWWQIVIMIVIALFLTVTSMGQSDENSGS